MIHHQIQVQLNIHLSVPSRAVRHLKLLLPSTACYGVDSRPPLKDLPCTKLLAVGQPMGKPCTSGRFMQFASLPAFARMWPDPYSMLGGYGLRQALYDGPSGGAASPTGKQSYGKDSLAMYYIRPWPSLIPACGLQWCLCLKSVEITPT